MKASAVFEADPASVQFAKAPHAESEIDNDVIAAEVENAATTVFPTATEVMVALPEVPTEVEWP
jgi:hypothetical protein